MRNIYEIYKRHQCIILYAKKINDWLFLEFYNSFELTLLETVKLVFIIALQCFRCTIEHFWQQNQEKETTLHQFKKQSIIYFLRIQNNALVALVNFINIPHFSSYLFHRKTIKNMKAFLLLSFINISQYIFHFFFCIKPPNTRRLLFSSS